MADLVSDVLSHPLSPLAPSSRVISKLFLRGFSGLQTTVSSGQAARRADFTSSAFRPYTRQLLLPKSNISINSVLWRLSLREIFNILKAEKQIKEASVCWFQCCGYPHQCSMSTSNQPLHGHFLLWSFSLQ